MQVVILAAGMGKRLKNKTKRHTKSMVQILGKTFIEHSLDKLTKFNISKIIIVIGYCGNEIKDTIGNSYNNIPIIYIENKDYATTNNIYSLYLTKDYLSKEDTLLLESDLIYDTSIIKKCLESPLPNIAVVDKYQHYMDGTVVTVNDRDEIVSLISKDHFNYKEKDSYYKTVNIYKFSKNFLKNEYLPFLEAYCKTMGQSGFYEQVLKVILSLEKNSVKVLKLSGEKWYEVDDLQDYDIAELLFNDDKTTNLYNYSLRYGGYWRFPNLIDFCYLVNPYFPTLRMLTELQGNFYKLLANYPSGKRVLDILVTNIWNIDPNFFLLGNGATELINALSYEVKGKVGIILPTFQEYPARIKNKEYFIPNNKDFSYTLTDLKNFSSKIDTLILINPDNPSGNFLTKSQLIDLLNFYKENHKQIILDESFVDFSSETINNSLLNNDILLEYPNLTIIKSISKSYGIPGLRLGILASSNTEFIKDISKHLPIWNINSFAEYFLQIFNKYSQDYLSACSLIVEERKSFFKKLTNIKFLRPISSQANFILCEVLPPFNSTNLCIKLLDKGFLIKDCKNKMGFNEANYIRIAVKDKKDNEKLIQVLQDLI